MMLTYVQDGNTQQTVSAFAACMDTRYAVVKVEDETCQVALKTNYTDASAYPMTSYTTTTSEQNGWASLDDRYKTSVEWQTLLDSSHADYDSYWKNYDFGTDAYGLTTDEATIINTTDYAANTVKFVQFQMVLYSSVGSYTGGYTTYGNYAFPNSQIQNGSGDGDQYAASKQENNYNSNIYIYIGDDNDPDALNYVHTDSDGNFVYDDAAWVEHGWVRYDVIFSDQYGTLQTYAAETEGYAAVEAFQAKYDMSIQGTYPDYSNDTLITYRLALRCEDTDGTSYESSRG